ncbi:MAG: alpha/beta fold hydrolase [Planctomycetota bacterium]|nr:alpha/beta fold hydrolase [Planctomycetota bacterium]
MRAEMIPVLLLSAACFAPAARAGAAGGGPASTGLKWVSVSEQAVPVEFRRWKASDGREVAAAVRRPPGKGPFPALIYLHGGLGAWTEETLRFELLKGPTMNRFLADGWMTLAADFRGRANDPLTTDCQRDVIDVVEQVRKLPEADPASVVLYGTSGGGSLALEVAAEIPLAAILVEEPAMVLFTGMSSKETLLKLGVQPPYHPAKVMPIIEDPQRFYTPELQAQTLERMLRISCPIFVGHGDRHPLNKLNEAVFSADVRAKLKQPFEDVLYARESHGFSRGMSRSPGAQKFYADASAFALRYLKTRPVAVDSGLLGELPEPSKEDRRAGVDR